MLWRVATNKCMYVKHIPQHNNLNPTSLLITLTVFVAGVVPRYLLLILSVGARMHADTGATNQPDKQTQTGS